MVASCPKGSAAGTFFHFADVLDHNSVFRIRNARKPPVGACHLSPEAHDFFDVGYNLIDQIIKSRGERNGP
jgi:hypothetical protein